MPGSGFVNFQRVLDLNRPQAEQQTDVLVGGVEKQATDAQTSIADTEKKHLTKIGGIAPQPAGTTPPLTSTLPTAPADQYGYEDSESKIKGFDSDVDLATGAKKGIPAAYGIQALAQEGQNAATYAPNMSMWDSALMFGSGAQDKFGSLKEKFKGLADQLAASRSKVDNAYGKAVSAVAATAPADPIEPLERDAMDERIERGRDRQGEMERNGGSGFPVHRMDPAEATLPAIPSMPSWDVPGGAYPQPPPAPEPEQTFDDIFRQYGQNRGRTRWQDP